MARTSQAVGYIVLTIRAERTGEFVEAECVELGVPSFGQTLEEAIDAAGNATCAYLEALTAEGELERVLKDHGLTIVPGEPTAARNERKELGSARPGEVVSARAFPVGALAGVG